jgi:uncharacterized protein
MSQIESGIPTDYYAPDFRLEVENAALDPESKDDVLDLKVVMDMENMTSAQLTINNWNDKTFELKYTDTKRFDIGNRVHVQLGYAGSLKSMMRGQIATMSPRFPSSGQPTIELTVLDGMLKLRDRKPAEGEQKKYVDKSDSEIAQLVAQRNGLDVKVTEVTQKHPLVVQKNQDDASFLMERAKRIDFDCYILTDETTKKDTLHFVRPTDARDGESVRVYTFEWGQSLISFSPVLTLSRQVASVTVRGWDPTTKESISYKATVNDLPGGGHGGESGPAAAGKNLSNKEEVVVDAPVRSKEEAQRLAIAMLRERAYEFITGTARAIGIPDLRPGDNVDITGIGKRFSGRYYVKKVEHSLGSGGYLTQFDVRRVYDGGVKT